MLAIWSLVPLPFLNPVWTSGSWQFTYLLKPCLENFEHYFASMWDDCSCVVVWHCLALPFFGIKTDLFQFCGHRWVFQICWHVDYSTLTASSFRICTAGISSPPIALFIVMLPKVHLTSHFRMSGFRWMIAPSWVSGSWRSFLYSSVYSCHLLKSSVSVRSIPLLVVFLMITILTNMRWYLVVGLVYFSWWLMMLSIPLSIYVSFVCLLWKNIYSRILFILKLDRLFAIKLYMSFMYFGY